VNVFAVHSIDAYHD